MLKRMFLGYYIMVVYKTLYFILFNKRCLRLLVVTMKMMMKRNKRKKKNHILK